MITKNNIITPFLLILSFVGLSFTSCELEDVVSGTSSQDVTESEIGMGLKDALTKGISEGAARLSQVDGYLGNPKIRIPWPEEAEKVANTLNDLGMNQLVEDVKVSINRAAEDAATEAKPIFVNAIKQMTITDARNILFGGNNAATDYLKSKTWTPLTDAFLPVIKTSLDKVHATKYWKDAITAYNKIPLVKDVNPDLPGYVNQKALDGLFFMVALEEEKIRENPVERTTALLKKVFDYYDKNK